MRIWILTRQPELDKIETHPITGIKSGGGRRRRPDEAYGFVVRARSARRARQLAAGEAGDEGREVWTRPFSTCRQLGTARFLDVTEEVVLRDFHGT